MTDYEQISIVGQIQGLLSRADSMTEKGIDLSKQKSLQDYRELVNAI